MSGGGELAGWAFYRFALFVTGDGERNFLQFMFRPLETGGHCHFKVVHQFRQRSPIRSETKQLKMVRQHKTIPDKDEEIGLMARKYLNEGYDFIVLVDDLERDRATISVEVYDRYRKALDTLLSPRGLESKSSVHFLVNMIEAYYFGDASAVNSVLGTQLVDFDGDVETIPHPKNELKRIVSSIRKGTSFDEVKDGRAIMQLLDVAKVLSRPETCRSLRTAFAWCVRAMRQKPTELFRLTDGQLYPVTARQIESLAPILD